MLVVIEGNPVKPLKNVELCEATDLSSSVIVVLLMQGSHCYIMSWPCESWIKPLKFLFLFMFF